MAGQRRGQLREHGARRRARPRGLVLALSLCLTLLAACGADPNGPDPFNPGRDRTGGASGGGAAEALLGTWRSVVVVQVPGDLQTWTTVWRFDADGVCRQTVETESLAEGFPRLTQRACTYTAAGSEITVSYVGAGVVTFEFSFAGFSPDRLVLDGFEYERLA